jgi:hypothetical protein
MLNSLTTSYSPPLADPRRTNVFVHILQRLTVFSWFPTAFISQGGLEWLATHLLPPEDPNATITPPLLDAAEILRHMFFLSPTASKGFEHLSLPEIERLLYSRIMWEYWQVDAEEGKELVRGCIGQLERLAQSHEFFRISLRCETLLEEYKAKWVVAADGVLLPENYSDDWCEAMSELIHTLKGSRPISTRTEGNLGASQLNESDSTLRPE